MEGPTPSLREQGTQALRDGDFSRAVEILGAAVAADPDDADVLGLLGIAQSQAGLHHEARATLRAAVERHPDEANLRFNLGIACERAGDLDGAADCYQETLRRNPEHAQARAKLSAVLPETGAPGIVSPTPTTTFASDGTAADGADFAPEPAVAPAPVAAPEPVSTPELPAAPAYTAPAYVPPSQPATHYPSVPPSPGVNYASLRPHRGGLVLGLGIGGLVSSPLSCCCFVGLVPLALAIVAWVLGQRDLADMNAGLMDEAGRGQTQTGRLLGMIGVGLFAVLTVVGLLVNVLAAVGSR